MTEASAPSPILTRIWRDRHQILACALGITGAALVAQAPDLALMRAGFGCWVVGNLLLVVIERRAGHPWLAGMFGIYLCGDEGAEREDSLRKGGGESGAPRSELHVQIRKMVMEKCG